MSTGNPEFFRKNRKNRRKYVPAVLQSIFENTPADEFADNGILRHIARGQRRQLPDDVHENVQSVRAHEFRRQLFRELRNLAQVLGQDARLIVVEKFKGIVENHGTLTSVDEWGKRHLAYPINDLTEGYYVYMTCDVTPDMPAELDRVFKITDGILRSIIVAVEE